MQKMKLHFHWLNPDVCNGFRSGVSLHSHTRHSRETMSVVSDYARQSRALSLAIRALSSRYRQQTGCDFDFTRPFFTLPLSASEAFRIEAGQIEEELNLDAFVSLTDHDSVVASQRLRLFMDETRVPLSLEWTVPFESSFFHLGIHNLPADGIQSLVSDLSRMQCARCHDVGVVCSAAGPAARSHAHRSLTGLEETFTRLNQSSKVLIVLNHPLWDIGRIGEHRQGAVLADFLARFERYIHAIEINGLRPWSENLTALELAERWRLPVVSGGDRHGCEPNAMLNLTRQTTFGDFVEEIRVERQSEILVMKQYREPLKLRKIRTAVDLLREYAHHPEGERRWTDRVFIPWRGSTVRLSSIWESEPALLQGAVSLFRMAERRPVRPLLRMIINDELDLNPSDVRAA
jgi:hypothetical protein